MVYTTRKIDLRTEVVEAIDKVRDSYFVNKSRGFVIVKGMEALRDRAVEKDRIAYEEHLEEEAIRVEIGRYPTEKEMTEDERHAYSEADN